MKKLYCFILLSVMSLCDPSRLNIASKIPAKSIKSPDGDIIDCIDIYHQPAFNHPLLKNHTILMTPIYHPKENGVFAQSKKFNLKTRYEEDTTPIAQLWQSNEECPEGTIPVLRPISTNRYGKNVLNSTNLPSANRKFVDRIAYEHAIAFARGKFFGAKVTMNVWKPQVQNDREHSLSAVWLIGGTGPNLNSIQAGWMVSPSLYRDNKTRFYIYWTRDGYGSTGCYNLLCPGFVQVTKRLALGAAIVPVSVYLGSQFEITLTIWKDRKQNAWWLNFGDITVGYWPASLFTDLANSASVLEWGGEVTNSNSVSSTQQLKWAVAILPKKGLKGQLSSGIFWYIYQTV